MSILSIDNIVSPSVTTATLRPKASAVRQSPPDDVVDTFVYDGLGRIIERELRSGHDRNARATSPEFRKSDKRIGTACFATMPAQFHRQVVRNQYQHSAAADVGLAETLFQYDRLGRLADNQDYDDPWAGAGSPSVQLKSVRFAYDAAGNFDWIQWSGDYDHVAIAWNSTSTSDYVFDKANRLTSISHPADGTPITHAYAYDNASRVRQFDTTDSNSTNRDYIYDKAGQLTSQTGGFDGAPSSTTTTAIASAAGATTTRRQSIPSVWRTG